MSGDYGVLRTGGMTYLAGDEHRAGPVAAVVDVRGVADRGDGVGHDLLGERLAGDASSAASSTLGEALLRGGDGERRGGEQHLSEEGESDHGGERRRREGVDSSGAVRTGIPS